MLPVWWTQQPANGPHQKQHQHNEAIRFESELRDWTRERREAMYVVHSTGGANSMPQPPTSPPTSPSPASIQQHKRRVQELVGATVDFLARPENVRTCQLRKQARSARTHHSLSLSHSLSRLLHRCLMFNACTIESAWNTRETHFVTNSSL